jgi:YidC/Oxa1 family membrane protein insertase
MIVAAKRVDVIDGYAEKLKIDKFDLVIDWGFLYFITKPLFLGLIISLNFLEIMV